MNPAEHHLWKQKMIALLQDEKGKWGHCELAYSIRPTFTDQFDLYIFRETFEGEEVIFPVLLNRDTEHRKFQTDVEVFNPFQGKRKPLVVAKIPYWDAKEFEQVWQEALRVKLTPIHQSQSVGLDGVTRYLQAGNYMSKTTFQWWGNLPECWDAFGPLVSFLDKICGK